MGKILGDVREHAPKFTGWAGAKPRHAGALIGVILLLWGTAADFTLVQHEVIFRQEFLAKALQAAGEGLSRAKFQITSKTSATLRPQRPCSGTAKDQLCYEFNLTTPSGPRAPSVEEHFTIAVDPVSGEAVFENTAKK